MALPQRDNVWILAHFRISALTEKDMDRDGYDFQSPDNEKPRLERGAEPDPRKSYSSNRLDAMVREKVERIVNAMLDAEADEIANAARYERSGEQKTYHASRYEQNLP